MAIIIGTIVIGPGIIGPGGARDAVRYLADCDWLTITDEAGRTGIGHSERARKLIEEATTPDVT